MIREDLSRTLKQKNRWKKGEKERLQMFRGTGLPQRGDILYGSIKAVALEEESLISLQTKLLFLQEVLQSADARRTKQTIKAVDALSERATEMVGKWEEMK